MVAVELTGQGNRVVHDVSFLASWRTEILNGQVSCLSEQFQLTASRSCHNQSETCSGIRVWELSSSSSSSSSITNTL